MCLLERYLDSVNLDDDCLQFPGHLCRPNYSYNIKQLHLLQNFSSTKN